jgi:hypothetical protein
VWIKGCNPQFALIEVSLRYLILYPIKPARTAHLTLSLIAHGLLIAETVLFLFTKSTTLWYLKNS